jgi:hypothetical protein
MPDIETIGEVSKAASAVVAAIAFVWSLYLWRKGERAKQILSWQHVVVFEIIKDRKTCTFNEIRSDYLHSHQQLKDVNVPKKEIQNLALKLVIIGLLEKKLVTIRKGESGQEDTYSISYHSVDEISNELRQLVIADLTKRNTLQKIASKIIDVLRTSSKQYSMEELFAFLTSEGTFNIDYTDYNNLIMGMRARKILIVGDGDKLKLGDLSRVDTYIHTTVTRTVEGTPTEKPSPRTLPSRPLE